VTAQVSKVTNNNWSVSTWWQRNGCEPIRVARNNYGDWKDDSTCTCRHQRRACDSHARIWTFELTGLAADERGEQRYTTVDGRSKALVRHRRRTTSKSPDERKLRRCNKRQRPWKKLLCVICVITWRVCIDYVLFC